MNKLPALFIPHGGGPCFFMNWDPPDAWDRMAAFLRAIPDGLESPPEAIVVISGHWEEGIATIQSNPAPSLLYDYHGFPAHTYQLEYPAPGSPALTKRIADLLAKGNIPSQLDPERGFDHGVFIPLKVAFPAADIPIVEVSLYASLDPVEHIRLGKALQPLREEGVLIIGSGMSYHNLRVMMGAGRSSRQAVSGSEQFDAWLFETLTSHAPETRERLLIDWKSAPAASDAHPREEHLLPLHVVVGAAGRDPGRRILRDVVMGSAQSAFQFG